MLITVLILGVLAAMAGIGYLGYVKDAKTAEGKAILGSLWTALQACAQAKQGTACGVDTQFGKVGLTTGGVTPDGRWTVDGGDASIDAANVYKLTSVLQAVGAEDANGITVKMSYDNGQSPPGSFSCTIAGTTSPC
jgi:Tfp pilus assembly protein PilE